MRLEMYGSVREFVSSKSLQRSQSSYAVWFLIIWRIFQLNSTACSLDMLKKMDLYNEDCLLVEFVIDSVLHRVAIYSPLL